MDYVLCYCCKNYQLVFEDTTEQGLCKMRKSVISAYDKVCNEFVMRKGLYTKRQIPDYCKNNK